ncbi:unnamed protein product [Caenorhabditis angaria]|uniref:Serine/threonine-protein kinase PLK n=1 Tax=Caenorhabditis angaria TaxID=860376 RepID=A0A9P1IFY5_9PELO|nr:unnamed protein product [Caenorhabditis angaria]
MNIAPRPLPPSKSQVRRDKQPPEVPQNVYDSDRNIYYEKGKFLGKGGFAHCYEFINRETRQMVAGKVVPKSLLVKQYQRDKMAQEVQIHRNLSHPNVVKLFHFFEDRLNVYITLELCPRRSLMELHKRRRAVTEPEARYFTYHIVQGVQYLHAINIIHRDLKLGNLFLNDNMEVKIGDFGLATTMKGDERKTTLCGTPNYIAPEVLKKLGHSFEVDIWAVGCILYILLFGTPPFESSTLEETYSRIKHNNYTIPVEANSSAATLIRCLLHQSPERRPHAAQILRDRFFTNGYMPERLPVSCLSMVPKFGRGEMEENLSPARGAADFRAAGSTRWNLGQGGRNGLAPVPAYRISGNNDRDRQQLQVRQATSREPDDAYLSSLFQQFKNLLSQNIPDLQIAEAILDEYQSPECLPIFWISKWVDYSDKYGIGYQLCDNSCGVLFNDNSRIMLDEAGFELTYIEKANKEHYFSTKKGDYPAALSKKITLLNYFRSYMNDHLLKAGEGVVAQRAGDDLARLPTLRVWFRTKSAIVFHLSNGTVQINFFEDHIKMILCPLMHAVTFIDQHKRFSTYKFSHLPKNGCPEQYMKRLKYAQSMVERLQTEPANAKDLPMSSSRLPASSSNLNFQSTAQPQF